MTIKQTGGIFGRNLSLNEIDAVDGNFSGNLTVDTSTLFVNSSNNRIGVGTTSPAEPLHVIGTVRSTTSSTGDNNFYATSTGGGAYRIYPDSATTGNPTWLHQSNSGEAQAWVIGGVERMRLNSSGNLEFPSGKGIDFSATSGTGTSELFSDYEEGSWTPTYTTDGTDFDSVNYDSRTHGRYVKIGSLVYVSCLVQTDGITVGSASGDVLIGGLPFTVSNDPSNAEGNTGAISSFAFAGDHPSVGFAMRNSTTIKLQYRATANGAVSDLQIADLNTGANDNFLQLALSYRV